MRQLDDFFSSRVDRTLYHYTGIGALLGLVETESIWASHAYYLNDSREILHACDVLKSDPIGWNRKLPKERTGISGSVQELASELRARSVSVSAQDFIPVHERTPGALNPHVTQSNIAQTICVPGWTRTIRPSTAYTNKMKARQMRERHLSGEARDYEEDHLVPLALAGIRPTIATYGPSLGRVSGRRSSSTSWRRRCAALCAKAR